MVVALPFDLPQVAIARPRSCVSATYVRSDSWDQLVTQIGKDPQFSNTFMQQTRQNGFHNVTLSQYVDLNDSPKEELEGC